MDDVFIFPKTDSMNHIGISSEQKIKFQNELEADQIDENFQIRLV
jgi:hypothetical protein